MISEFQVSPPFPVIHTNMPMDQKDAHLQCSDTNHWEKLNSTATPPGKVEFTLQPASLVQDQELWS